MGKGKEKKKTKKKKSSTIDSNNPETAVQTLPKAAMVTAKTTNLIA